MKREVLHKTLSIHSNPRKEVTSRVVLTEKLLPPLIHYETTKLSSITWRQTKHNCNWEDFV